MNELPFNPAPPTIMHLDINSCFATIEQQANPHLRGKPIGVAAYQTNTGIILAASVEAKRLGVSTAMPIFEAKKICPNLIILKPDPDKYRHVHQVIHAILRQHTDQVTPRSIDEFSLNLEHYPAAKVGLEKTARLIKQQINQDVGSWITVSIGIGANLFLAKTASNLEKPDGLQTITKASYWQVYGKLSLTDLHGINTRNQTRLRQAGIHTVRQMYQAPIAQLKTAFRSISSYYWYLRLRGWPTDQVEFSRKSFGNQYSLPRPYHTDAQLTPVLTKLVEKTALRLRRHGYVSQGVHLGILYRQHGYWHKGLTTAEPLFSASDIFHRAYQLLRLRSYYQPVKLLSLTCFNLKPLTNLQLDLFGSIKRRSSLADAVQKLNERFGQYSVASGRMLYSAAKEAAPDHIGFGNIRELTEVIPD